MPSLRWTWLNGLVIVLGGALWSVGAILRSRLPEGCVAAECEQPGRSMRGGGGLDETLLLAGMLLALAGMIGMVRRAQAAGRFGVVGRAGLTAGGIGVGLLLGGGVIQAAFYDGDFPLMPGFVIPGLLALIAGLVCVGVAVLRAGVVPRSVGALLVVGAVAMLGFNEQNERVLLALPLGIAWMAAGYALWSDRERSGLADTVIGRSLPPRPS